MEIASLVEREKIIRNLHCLISDFLNYPPLPELMQGAGVAILTLLISFAIGIFIHHLGDGDKKGNFLDLHVALDYVWLFKPSLFVLAIVVTSPFFMGVENLNIKLGVFILWLLSLIYLFWILLRLYSWVKGDKDEFRKSYLSNFPKSTIDKIVSWRNFWSMKITDDSRFLEKDFFIPFSNEVDRLLKSEKKEDWKIVKNLLEDYVNNIQNRNKVFLLVFPEFFPKILEWHFILWQKQYSGYAKNQIESKQKIDISFSEADRMVDNIIKFVTKEALLGNNRSFSYFKTLDEHIQKYQDEFIEGDKLTYFYIEYIPIYEDCFDYIPNSESSHDIWHHFPESWKITIKNLKSNKISKIWYGRFIEWSRSRLWREDREWDKELEELSGELFPEVDPITWAKIYTFVFGSSSGSRIKNIIEKKINFGYAGRVVSGWGNDAQTKFSELYEGEIEATLDLAVYLFGKIFTETNLVQWLAELETLEYQENTDEFRKKQVWKGILSALKKRVKKI